jgi:translation initiation factor 5B
VGFNTEEDEEAKDLIKFYPKIKIITNEVVYKLIEYLEEFRILKQQEIQKARLIDLASIAKIKILHQFVFRNSNPAIFGSKVEAGKIIQQVSLIDELGEKMGKIKNIQSEKSSVQEATKGMEVAISIPGMNFERQLKEKNFLYSDISETQFRNFKKNKDLLSDEEKQALSEIAEIKRKENSNWGM